MSGYAKRLFAHLLAFAGVALIYGFGLLDSLELRLMDLRFATSERNATQQIVVVEIDERSLRLLNVWPWPRSYHAQLIDRLNNAGARVIAVDIDFSSRANAGDDHALGQALARAERKVVLPVFKQHSGLDRDRRSLAETGPMDVFREHVQLGSVVVRPDSDSLVRRAGTSLLWGGESVPSFPVRLSGRDFPYASFHIDYSIDLETLPRISYVDVLRGEFPPGMFEGRAVIVGASAVELGDQLPTPRWVSLPGPYVLALAGDTLLQNRALQRPAIWLTLTGALLLAVLLGPRFEQWRWYTGLGAVVGSGLLCFAGSALVQRAVPVSLDITPWLFTPTLSYLYSLWMVIDRQALRIFRQRMAVLHRSAVVKRVVESSFDGVITLDHNGRIDLFNPAAERMFGVQAAAIMGQRPDRLLRDIDSDGHAGTGLADLVAGPSPSYEAISAKGVRENGTSFEAEISFRRIVLQLSKHPFERRETPRAIHVLTVRDVTEQRQNERMREEAMAQAVAANKAKTEFLAMMSHELRTPLNAVIGFSEIIRDELFGPAGSEQYVNYASDIHRSGSHLLSIINDILDISRIEAGKFELNETLLDLPAAIEAVLRIVKGRPEAGRLAWHVDVPAELPGLLGDERAVKQILLNLLSNAVKFTPEGGRIGVAAKVTRHGELVVRISDTGIGIPADSLKRVTEPFFQADSALSRQYEGTGLGLPLTRSLIELHGGELVIASRPGKGTIVSCRFPTERLGMTTGPNATAAVA